MYANLKAIYRRDMGVFPMAVANLLDIGFRRAQKITDEEIERLEENGLMTKEFVQALVRTTRDIALECENNVVEIIQFCMAEEVFSIDYYKEEE